MACNACIPIDPSIARSHIKFSPVNPEDMGETQKGFRKMNGDLIVFDICGKVFSLGSFAYYAWLGGCDIYIHTKYTLHRKSPHHLQLTSLREKKPR